MSERLITKKAAFGQIKMKNGRVVINGDKSQPGTFTDTNIRDCRTRKIYPTKWLSYPLLVLLLSFYLFTRFFKSNYRFSKNIIVLDIGSQSKGCVTDNLKPHFGVKCISSAVFLPAA